MDRIYHQYIDWPTWNLTRILRVAGGLGLLIFALVISDGITTIFGALLLLQGLLNVGCMGGACAVPPPIRNHDTDPIVQSPADE